MIIAHCFLNGLLHKSLVDLIENVEVYATQLLRPFGTKEVLSRTRQFSEGSTLINVSLHIDYDSLENIHKVHSVP